MDEFDNMLGFYSLQFEILDPCTPDTIELAELNFFETSDQIITRDLVENEFVEILIIKEFSLGMTDS